MRFTMPVDKVVATRQGHTIDFKRGVPTHVPKECWREVQSAGAVPEDQAEVAGPQGAAAAAPTDPNQRREAIFASFQSMYEANNREDFGGNGVPTEKALNKSAGFTVDKKEREAMWVEFRQGGDLSDSSALDAAKAAADTEAQAEAAAEIEKRAEAIAKEEAAKAEAAAKKQAAEDEAAKKNAKKNK